MVLFAENSIRQILKMTNKLTSFTPIIFVDFVKLVVSFDAKFKYPLKISIRNKVSF
jgi:hypothetical protein